MRWKQIKKTCLFASQSVGTVSSQLVCVIWTPPPPPSQSPSPLLPEEAAGAFSKWAGLHLLMLQVQMLFYFSSLTLLVPALFLLTLLPCRTSSSSSSCTSRTRALRHCFALPRERQIKQGCGGETPPPSLPLPFLFILCFGGWNLLPPHVGKHEMRSVFGGSCGVKRSENLIFTHASRGLFKTMRPEEPPPSTPPSTHPEKQQLGRRWPLLAPSNPHPIYPAVSLSLFLSLISALTSLSLSVNSSAPLAVRAARLLSHIIH